MIAGYLIPKGWCVLASFISVHMDEDIYENPYQFDPWRWDVRDYYLSLITLKFINTMVRLVDYRTSTTNI